MAVLSREESSVRDVCLSLLFPHCSPRPVGIPEIPPCSLAPRVPSDWWELEEVVEAAGGGFQVAIMLLLDSTFPSLVGSAWDLCNFISGRLSCFKAEKIKFLLKTLIYQEYVDRRRKSRRSRSMMRIVGASEGG